MGFGFSFVLHELFRIRRFGPVGTKTFCLFAVSVKGDGKNIKFTWNYSQDAVPSES